MAVELEKKIKDSLWARLTNQRPGGHMKGKVSRGGRFVPLNPLYNITGGYFKKHFRIIIL